jgi:hypothetical protein
MRTKARLLIAASMICLAGSATVAFADEKSHRKAAEDLLMVMGVDTQMQASIDQTLDLQAKANPQLTRFRPAMKKFFAKYMSWDVLKDDFIKIYTDAFEEDELKEIKAFYETPIGKKMVKKMPELMSKGMQLGASRVQQNMPELQQMIQEEAQKKADAPATN